MRNGNVVYLSEKIFRSIVQKYPKCIHVLNDFLKSSGINFNVQEKEFKRKSYKHNCINIIENIIMEIPVQWKLAFPNMKMNPYLHFLCHVPMLLIKWYCLASRNNQGKEASHVFRRKLQSSSSNNDSGKPSSIPQVFILQESIVQFLFST